MVGGGSQRGQGLRRAIVPLIMMMLKSSCDCGREVKPNGYNLVATYSKHLY